MRDTPHDTEPKASNEPRNFAAVFATEWREIRRRRRFISLRERRGAGAPVRPAASPAAGTPPAGTPSRPVDACDPAGASDSATGDAMNCPPSDLAGLALSGGGIRSATFNLGLLQGLRKHGMLSAFDYLSTVSGGGYVGGWWSAWLARDPLFGPEEILGAQRFAAALLDITNPFSGFLRERFTPPGLAAARAVCEGNDSPELVREIVDELNRVMRGTPIYTIARALRVPLREATAALAQEGASQTEPSRIDSVQLNRMVLEDAYPGLLRRCSYIERGFFPPEEWIEPERSDSYLYEPEPGGKPREELRTKVADGAMSAGRDPVHHLRLFANYLTPRKGALSGDTWRAVAVISRNLILSWFILIPIFLAVMLCGQMYYVINPSTTEDFLHRRIDPVAALATALSTASRSAGAAADTTAVTPPPGARSTPDNDTAAVAAPAPDMSHEVSSGNVLLMRFVALAVVILPFVGWIMVLVIAWIICGQDGTALRHRFVPWIEVFAVTALVLCFLWIFRSQAIANFSAMQLNGYSVAGVIGWWGNWYAVVSWAVVAVILLAHGLRTRMRRQAPPVRGGESDVEYAMAYAAWERREDSRRRWRREVRCNKLVRLHSRLLVLAVLITAVLLIGGFSHELINYVFYQPEPKAALAGFLKLAGGWVALLGTMGGAIFTAIKASPMGGGDRKSIAEASGTTRAIVAATPTAVVLLLGFLAAWWAHGALGNIVINDISPRTVAEHFLQRSEPLHYATFIGIVLAFVFAWYEMNFTRGTQWASRMLITICLVFAVPLLSMAMIALYARHFAAPSSIPAWMSTDFAPSLLGPMHPAPHLLSVMIALLAGIFLVVRMSAHRPRLVTNMASKTFVLGRGRDGSRVGVSPWGILAIVVLALGIVAVLAFWIIPIGFLSPGSLRTMNSWLFTNADRHLTAYTIIGFILCMVYLTFELFTGHGSNNRSLTLLAAAYGVLLVHLVISYLPAQTFDSPLTNDPTAVSMIVLRAHAAFGLITTFLAWAIALGWTVDPNMLSIHEFYKSRLTRAYMGASNYKRHEQQSQITETVEGDDVQLARLRNCERGGPYHLVNATLNLVGGSDLTTAQRSAANFTMTRYFCGSVRTGYRETERYMDGRATLGAAVSISGAAASPVMGSKTPTAALAMLMTMFNVKLGYWAPTPNRDSWRSSQARLWPFYTLRELTSQTNDLSSYCYLTDGGHFDNTGIYALVERGCRYIVLADCGADPAPCFSDLGDALRRCRIDFGLECELDVEPVRMRAAEKGADRYAPGHFAVGKLIYSEAHFQKLDGGCNPIPEADRTGYIVVVRPTLTRDETIDVRQYGFENRSFPQQSLVDQWFDEAQFESYRKLGEISVERLLDHIAGTAKSGAESAMAATSSTSEDVLGIVSQLRNGSVLEPEDIPRFFGGVHALIRSAKQE